MKRIFITGLICLVVVVHGGTADARSFYPFYDRLTTEQGSFFAVRPLYSHTILPEGEVRDYFWPLYSRKDFKDEQSSRALIFWYTHKFDSKTDTPRQRRWLLPVYFQGCDANGKGYFALFPLGGTIRDFLGRDEIAFVLFPAFGKSRINEVETTSVLWPVYSHTRGDGIQRDRVFPVYGISVSEGKYKKKFVFWPFWTSAEYFYPGDEGRAWILFPLCGRADMAKEHTLWLVPPFFRFTEGAEQNRLYCPWPFVQKVESEKFDKFYIWPLWGEKQFAGGLKHRTFLLWPVFWSEKSTESDSVKTRRMALPFFFSEGVFQRPDGNPEEERVKVANYWKIWPLMSWQREADVSRFRMLEFWPIKNSPPVERNWAPLWTLYKRTDQSGKVSKDMLWFAWHSEKEPDAEREEWSLLKGLLAYKKEGSEQSLRVFYFIRLGSRE